MLDEQRIRTDWQEQPEVVVSEAIAAAMAETDPSASVDALLSYIGQSMNADRAYIFELSGTDVLGNTYEWCAPGVSVQIGNLRRTPLKVFEPVWLPQFLQNKAVVIPDVEVYAQQDPVIADILRPQGIVGMVAIPLFLEGDFVGFIGIDNPAQGVMDGMAAFLQTLASFTSALLRHRNNVHRLSDLSSHDRVTGAFDTLYLLDQVEWARKTGELAPKGGPDISDIGNPRDVYVVYCNLVQFKEYNGVFGMDEGNRCLTDVANALRRAFGTRCVSRFSADHFIVFYGRNDVRERIADAHQRVLQLRDGFKLWLEAGVCKPSDDQSLSTAVDLAKVACDQIPKDGRTFTCCYTGAIEEELERKKYLQDHIDQAVSEGWVQVYFQPVIRTLTGRLAGVEALSRWNDPKYGNVSPGVFVPALEEKHLSWKLLTCVIDRVCADVAERYHHGFPVVPVSVNVSRTDFESCRPFDVIQAAVHRYGIPSRLICVEITESVAMGDPEGIEAVVERFRSAGYEVWMDDFGSAYSSLNTLKDFTFGKLKLDMLFMHNFNQRSKDIIGSIISMAKKLGVHTLAEGVETREQVDFLIDAGCEEIQGFYFSRPLPLDQVIEFGNTTPAETTAQRDLYNEIGLVKLHTYESCGFLFCKDDTVRLLYANQRLRKRLSDNGIDAPEKMDVLLNDADSRIAQAFQVLIKRALKSGVVEILPFAANGHNYRVGVQRIAESAAGRVLLVDVQDITAPSAVMEITENTSRYALGTGLTAWAPVLLRQMAEQTADAVDSAAAGDASASDPSMQNVPTAAAVPMDGLSSRKALVDDLAHSIMGDEDRLDLGITSRDADELRRGFSVPSTDIASLSMAIRHSKGDALETFSALSSIFITLVNVDFRTWEVQPLVIAKVTENYLGGDQLDYPTVVQRFLEHSVAPAYQEALQRFTDPQAIVDRLSQYGTVTIDYIGANLGWCRLFLIPIATDDNGRVTKGLFAARDVNDEKAEEQRLNYHVTHDPLTKAFNRNGLRQVIGLIRGYTGPVAYAIFDVDNFKEYNDTYGHEAGDKLLVRIAQLLIDNFGATDYVARIGGDEFVILLTHYDRDRDGAAIKERIDWVNQVLANAREDLLPEGWDVPADGTADLPIPSLSAGIVISRDGYRDDLYGLADRVLYDEKAAGKGDSSVRVLHGTGDDCAASPENETLADKEAPTDDRLTQDEVNDSEIQDASEGEDERDVTADGDGDQESAR